MSNLINADDFAGADPELMALVMAESDKRIASQVQIMLAADGRANGLLAATTALAAAGIAVVADQVDTGELTPLLVAALVFAIFAVGAAACCIWALWPMGVDVPGWSPRLFKLDVGKDVSRIYAEVACMNQEKILGNETCNVELSRRAKLAMALLVLAPVASGCGAAIAAGGFGYVIGGLMACCMSVFGIKVLMPLARNRR